MKKVNLEFTIEQAAAVCASLQVACIDCDESKVFEETLDTALEQVISQLLE